MEDDDFGLPDSVRPRNYDLLFDVDLSDFRFSGKESIELEVSKPTKEIVLNMNKLSHKRPRLLYKGKPLEPVEEIKKAKTEKLILRFDEAIDSDATLQMEFEGELDDSLVGLYRSKYALPDGTEKYMATTQFEAPYARLAFPCFDEPRHKATFNVSVKADWDLQAISNMPVRNETFDDGHRKTVSFERTPKMSTYLLYLGVGDFEYIEDKLDDTVIRVITTPGKKEQGRFALEMAKNAISYFQEYTGIRYPLPKLDLIAIPDFGAGAMENWGAITFRENLLLADDKTSVKRRQRMAEVIYHEIAHQWYGDWVTMIGWPDLWLNESFATFMAYKGVDKLFPQWRAWDDFVTEETSGALNLDSLKTTHPIHVEVKNPHEVEEIFDEISYNKGGSVLRMIENYLGEEVFRKGVSKYLRKYMYGNADSADLWDSLAEVSDVPVKEIMEEWVKQPGYPVVEAKTNKRCLKLRQNRLLFGKKSLISWLFGDKQKWPIPISIKTGDGQGMSTDILDSRKKKIPMRDQWAKLNYGHAGFYITKYSDKDLSKLKELVSGKQLPAVDRWGLQQELMYLSLAGETTLDKYLDFIKAYHNEDDYFVLRDISKNMKSIWSRFHKEDFWPSAWPQFKEHVKEPFKTALERLGWESVTGESHTDSLMRGVAVDYMAFLEDADVIRRCDEKFEGYLRDADSLNPDLIGAVVSVVVGNSDFSRYGQFFNLYDKPRNLDEKLASITSLGGFKDERSYRESLDSVLSGKVRIQDLRYLFPSLASNPHHKDLFTIWVKDNWNKMESYKDSPPVFMDIIENTISYQAGREKEDELREFFDAHPVEYKRILDKSFEIMRRSTKWIETNRSLLANYLNPQPTEYMPPPRPPFYGFAHV